MTDFNAEVVQVIRTFLTTRGKGITGDPIRCIEQYWTLDGKLLFEYDPDKCPNPGMIPLHAIGSSPRDCQVCMDHLSHLD